MQRPPQGQHRPAASQRSGSVGAPPCPPGQRMNALRRPLPYNATIVLSPCGPTLPPRRPAAPEYASVPSPAASKLSASSSNVALAAATQCSAVSKALGGTAPRRPKAAIVTPGRRRPGTAAALGGQPHGTITGVSWGALASRRGQRRPGPGPAPRQTVGMPHGETPGGEATNRGSVSRGSPVGAAGAGAGAAIRGAALLALTALVVPAGAPLHAQDALPSVGTTVVWGGWQVTLDSYGIHPAPDPGLPPPRGTQVLAAFTVTDLQNQGSPCTEDIHIATVDGQFYTPLTVDQTPGPPRVVRGPGAPEPPPQQRYCVTDAIFELDPAATISPSACSVSASNSLSNPARHRRTHLSTGFPKNGSASTGASRISTRPSGRHRVGLQRLERSAADRDATSERKRSATAGAVFPHPRVPARLPTRPQSSHAPPRRPFAWPASLPTRLKREAAPGCPGAAWHEPRAQQRVTRRAVERANQRAPRAPPGRRAANLGCPLPG